MSNYERLDLLLRVSDQEDYNQGVNHTHAKELTTWTNQSIKQTISALTTGTSISLAHLTSVNNVIVENKDSANDLWAYFTQERASITFASGDLTFAAGPPGTITIVAGAEDWTAAANTFKTHSIARITGCTDSAANNTDYDIQAVSASALTAFEAETVTAQVTEAGVVTVKNMIPCRVTIPAGRAVVLTDLVPADGLTLTAITATVLADVSYTGVV